MKKFRIVFTDLLLFSLLGYTLFQVPLTVYGLGQARGQFLIVWNAKDIKELIATGKFNQEETEKLLLVEKIKTFSVDSLNYKPSPNYTNYFDQQGKSLLWIVTACRPFKFEDYEWDFPYLGKVSYRGYFDSLKAEKEGKRLKKLGYDIDVGKVNAWSTLGWFKDPVFSEMLKKHKGELANLLFHELFHGTIYAQNSVDLNENLANFIAHKATMQFLQKDSTELNLYLKDHAEEALYDKFIFKCIGRLDSLYKTFSPVPDDKIKKEKKIKLLHSFTDELKDQDLLPEKTRKKMKKRFLRSGNAYFMHFTRYDGLADSLEGVLQKKYRGNLSEMIKGLRTEIKSL
ncbi:MAG: aminopeptidase [Bacteroidia bacterium]|nr:aminopeptidase [Bacteroidia bacterium]